MENINDVRSYLIVVSRTSFGFINKPAGLAERIDMFLPHSKDKWFRILVFGIIVGIVLRSILGYVLTFNYDTNAWIITSGSIDAYGSIYQGNGLWYPPVWGCILAVVSFFASMLGIDQGTICYELAGSDSLANVSSMYVISPDYAFLFKVVLFIFDIINVWLIYRIMSRKTDSRKTVIISLLWFLCPLVIWSSAIACQIDTISVTFMLLSIYFLLDKKYFLAGSMLSFGFLTKLFPACLLFMFIAYVLAHSSDRHDQMKNLFVGIIGTALTTIVLLLPFIVNGELSSVFSFYSGRASMVSAGSANVFQYSPFTFNNIINYMPLVLLAMVLIAWSYYSKVSRCGDDDHRIFLTHSLLSFMTIFIFGQTLTYPVIMVPLLACYVVLLDRRLVISYALLSIISTLYCFSNFHAWLLCSVSVYWEIIPLDSLLELISDLSQPMSYLFEITSVLGVLPVLSAIVLMLYRRFENAKT